MAIIYDGKGRRILDLKHACAIYAPKNNRIVICFPFADNGGMFCEELELGESVDESEFHRFFKHLAQIKNIDSVLIWERVCENVKKKQQQ
ncbi:MAG: hypothetical protein J7J01_01275 [Methanophagales archaeon]|nr:hypothetical protein [Methanophagales archaeon]